MLSKMTNKPKIKICGLRDTATIEEMNGLAVDYIGLVFAKSKRQVTLNEGKTLVKAIHQLKNANGKKVEAVAVCVNMPIDQLQTLVHETKLDIIQLHGQEDEQYILHCKASLPDTKLWKAISIVDEQQINLQIKQLSAYVHHLDALVLDAPGGGTGKVFNWEAIQLFQQLLKAHRIPLIVAGGLQESNVEHLLNDYGIDGVDVSSGVETAGIKDIIKIKRFVGKVIEL